VDLKAALVLIKEILEQAKAQALTLGGQKIEGHATTSATNGGGNGYY